MPRGKNLRPEAANGKRFGDPGGADPRQATKMGPPKWSTRKQLAYLAAQNININDPKAFKNLLGDNPTVATVIAAALLTKASKGHTDAINSALDNIDGKLPQTNINAEYEAIKDAGEEELDAIISAGLGYKAYSGAGDSGEEAEAGSEGESMDAVPRAANRGAKKPR
jgi:hypothetical protein